MWSPTVATIQSNCCVHLQFLKRDVIHFLHCPLYPKCPFEVNHLEPHERSFFISFYLYCIEALPSLNEVVFQYVQAAHHLGKDEHPVATSLQFGQQLVNQHELASSLDHRLELKIWRVCIVCFFKLFQNFLFSTCRDWTA